MTIEQNWSADVMLVSLSPEPQMGDELEEVFAVVVLSNCVSDVVIDFSEVRAITDDSNITRLLNLRLLIRGNGYQLILCGLGEKVTRKFRVMGFLEAGTFPIRENKDRALAALTE